MPSPVTIERLVDRPITEVQQDPCIYVEAKGSGQADDIYLVYSTAGEQGIDITHLNGI